MNINKQQRTGSSTFMLIAGIACVGIAVITSLDLFTPAATGSIEPIESIATPQLITKKIEDIRPGDMVVSKDEVTGEVTRNKVVRLFRNTSDHLRVLEFRHNDNDSATHRIETTNAHPFRVKDSGWVDAADLRPGDQVETSDSSLAVLVSTRLEHHTEGVPVFNFEVANAHSYYVQNPDARGPPIWVHNDCGPDGFIPLEAVEQAAQRAGQAGEGEGNVVYRLLRPDESFDNGINPKANAIRFEDDYLRSLSHHVAYGTNAESRFVSTTRSLEVARAWQRQQLREGGVGRIVEINLDAIDNQVFDLTTEAARNRFLTHYGSNISRNSHRFAAASQEVVIDGAIPREAINGVSPWYGILGY